MLGQVRRRQKDDDPTLAPRRPATSIRLTDFYKSVQIQAQHRRIECQCVLFIETTLWADVVIVS